MKRCIIITAYINGEIREITDIKETDYIICTDRGYELALSENIAPNVVLGDFDSSEGIIPDIPKGKILTFPVEKDDTDTMLALKHALPMKFDRIIIVGGLGGRLDHTVANLHSLNWVYEQEKIMNNADNTKHNTQVIIADRSNQVQLLVGEHAHPRSQTPYIPNFNNSVSCKHSNAYSNSNISTGSNTLRIKGAVGNKFSLLPLEGICTGVCAAPAKWQLSDAKLTSAFPLGISNEFVDSFCNIEIKTGKLLVIKSFD